MLSKRFVESMDLSNTFVMLGVGISAGTRPNAAGNPTVLNSLATSGSMPISLLMKRST